MLQTMLPKLLLNKKMLCYFYTLLQHSKPLLICCLTKPCVMLHHKPVTKPALLSYTIQNMSTKLVKNCSMQSSPSLHHNNPKIAPKWKRKFVWRKCQSSKKKQFKITYVVSPLNHSKRSTKEDCLIRHRGWDFWREKRKTKLLLNFAHS